MNLNFADGTQEFVINNDPDRVIRFNPGDFGILERLKAAGGKIDEIGKRYADKENTPEVLAECDRELRGIIDEVFANKIADTAFGKTNCLSFAGGKPIFENFLDAVVPVIEQNVRDESEKSKARIDKYTKRVK